MDAIEAARPHLAIAWQELLVACSKAGLTPGFALRAALWTAVGYAGLVSLYWQFFAGIPQVVVPLDDAEPVLSGKKFDPKVLRPSGGGLPKSVFCWDPSTMDELGTLPVMSKAEVEAVVARAHVAQQSWAKSSFGARRQLLRVMLRWVTENQRTIARVAVRESGKTLTDAAFGEVLVTCEKLSWTIANGEKYLKAEGRQPGTLMMTKSVRVEWVPVGVVGAIVPWNYPFHNVFNPIVAALFSGNAIVIKVSEYASWSTKFLGAAIRAILSAAGAPVDLVQFVTGYGPTGAALVNGGVDKVIFVGSPEVGVRVMRAAADTLTPVVLELGGKDPFVVCEDWTDWAGLAQVACRGVFQNMGQNCAGPERFLVYDSVHDRFCDAVAAVAAKLRTGPALDDALVDCGAVTMGAPQMANYQRLVDDAVSKGARIVAGGYTPRAGDPLAAGSFYPPTVLADVPESAVITQEEIFGPIMCIIRVPRDSDDEAVRIANSCEFGLSSCCFAADAARASRVAARLRAGMSATNDLEGTTYMSQSLPFGGCGKSGFDRFAGPEGLRGLCYPRAVSEDKLSWLRTSIPPPLRYPSTGAGPDFAMGLIQMTFGYGVAFKARGLLQLLRAVAAK